MPRVLTHTTPRGSEEDSIAYYFETDNSFEKNHYLERVQYAGYKYGSSYEALERAWGKSICNNCLGHCGAITYSQELGEQAAIIFVTVTHPDMLIDRVQVRGDDPLVVEQRIASPEFLRDVTLPKELKNVPYELANDDWAKTKVRLDLLVNDIMSYRSLTQKR